MIGRNLAIGTILILLSLLTCLALVPESYVALQSINPIAAMAAIAAALIGIIWFKRTSK